MRTIAPTGLLASLLLATLGASPARAQGWDYGRNMFGFVQSTPGLPWTGQYHPGDGRPGIYYVDAGDGNFFGDPRGRPLVPAVPDRARAPRLMGRHRVLLRRSP